MGYKRLDDELKLLEIARLLKDLVNDSARMVFEVLAGALLSKKDVNSQFRGNLVIQAFPTTYKLEGFIDKPYLKDAPSIITEYLKLFADDSLGFLRRTGANDSSATYQISRCTMPCLYYTH